MPKTNKNTATHQSTDFLTEACWFEIKKLVNEFYMDVLRSLSMDRLKNMNSNIFYSALVGKASQQSRLERTIVTKLGSYAPRFFMVWFKNASMLDPPFDFKGEIHGRTLYVKVVSSDKTFNSVEKKEVESQSNSYPDPVILTLQGSYFKPIRIGKAMWLSAPSSWKIVGGTGAYTIFIRIVSQEANKYREEIWRLLLPNKSS